MYDAMIAIDMLKSEEVRLCSAEACTLLIYLAS